MKTRESERINDLYSYEILDTSAEKEYDDLVAIASEVCQAPIALISLVDVSRQWFKSKVGLPVHETPRAISFCQHVVEDGATLVVPDTHLDPRFAANPLVTGDPRIRFYAGAVLRSPRGHNLGTLCVIDSKPRQLTSSQIEILEKLAKQVTRNLELRRATFENQRRQEIMDRTLSMVPGLVSYLTPDLTYLYVNSFYEKVYGMPRAQIMGQPIAKIIGVEAFQTIEPKIKRCLAGETTTAQGQVNTYVEGRNVSFDFSVQYQPDISQGKVVGIFVYAADTTEANRIQQKLLIQNQRLVDANSKALESETEFRLIFEEAPVGMVELDANFKLKRVNPAFARMLKYSKEELIGLSILDLTEKTYLADTRRILKNVTHVTHEASTYEKSYVAKDGSLVHARVNVRTLMHPTTAALRIFGVIENMTEERERDLELQDARAQLITSAKLSSLGEMAGGVAHEINNPLAIIRGRADLMTLKMRKNSLSTEDIEKGLSTILTTTHRIGQIISGLQRIANPGGQLKSDVDLRALIDDIFSLCSERFRQDSVELICDAIPETEICCDSTLLSQAILNLLTNAYEAVAGKEDAWVRLSFAIDSEHFEIQINDSGRGIDSHISDKMMQPFFTTKEVGKGTGLGLSIARSIVRSQSGELSYRLTKDGHTSFVIRLPCALSRAA